MAGIKLLVADDSLTIQKVIRLALSSSMSSGEGYEIQAVSDGNDAIQQIALFRPDIVLIDVSLPGKTAFEVKRAINEHVDLRNTRFVLMSSAFEKVDEGQAEEVEFHGRLTKPFDPAHLREVLISVRGQITDRHHEPTVVLKRPPSSQAPTAPAPAPYFTPLPPQEMPVAELPPLPPDTESVHEWSQPQFNPADLPPLPEEIAPFAALPEELPPLPANEPTFAGLRPNEFAPPAPDFTLPDFQQPRFPEEESAIGAPPLPTSFPPAQTGGGGDSDIRQLTESTIRMSGLDDFQWSVQEPSLKPPTGMFDADRVTFPPEPAPRQSALAAGQAAPALEQAEVEYPGLSTLAPYEEPAPDPRPVLQQPPTLAPPPASPLAPPPFAHVAVPTAPAQTPVTPAAAPPTPAAPPSIQAIPIDAALMEKIIREEVEKALRKATQEVLPEIAEKVIKEEINRLLREQP